jgi:hypothetical protein
LLYPPGVFFGFSGGFLLGCKPRFNTRQSREEEGRLFWGFGGLLWFISLLRAELWVWKAK